MVLPGHWSKIAHLPEEPLQHLDTATQIRSDKLAGLLGEIQQNCARFEDRNRTVARCRRMIEERRYPIVWGYPKVGRIELFAFADIDRLDRVGKACFFREQQNLVPLGVVQK